MNTHIGRCTLLSLTGSSAIVALAKAHGMEAESTGLTTFPTYQHDQDDSKNYCLA